MITLLAAAILIQVGPTVDFPWAGGVEASVAVSADIIAIGGVALVCNQWGAGVCNPRKRRLENHRERRKFVSP